MAIKDQRCEGVYYKNFRWENCFTNDISITAEFSAQSRCSKHNYMPQHYFFNIRDFMIYRQNICGLTNKSNEIVTSIYL
jgi:hypothetical protein